MAGTELTDYLAHEDLDRFVAIMRRYSHDVLSSASNIAIAAEVAAKLLRRRAESILIDPSTGEDAALWFDALLQDALAFPRDVRWLVWGETPDDQDASRAYVSERWYPYDAQQWDRFVAEYIDFVVPRIEALQATIREVDVWRASGVLTPPEQSSALLDTLSSMRQSLGSVWRLLDPAAAEARAIAVIENEINSRLGG